MSLYNNPVPAGISNLRFQGSPYNPTPPAITQPTKWDEFVEVFWDAKMKTQCAIAAVKIVAWYVWRYFHGN